MAGAMTLINTEDMARSRRFYEEGLQLPVRQDRGAVVFYALNAAGATLCVAEIVVASNRGGERGIWHAQPPWIHPSTPQRDMIGHWQDTVMLCLLTDDVDGHVQRLEEHGYRIEQQPREQLMFGYYSALVRDPDGHLVQLQRFLDPEEHWAFTSAAPDEGSAPSASEGSSSSEARRFEREPVSFASTSTAPAEPFDPRGVSRGSASASDAAAAPPSYVWTDVGISMWAAQAPDTYAQCGSPGSGAEATQEVLKGWKQAGFSAPSMVRQGWLKEAPLPEPPPEPSAENGPDEPAPS